MAKPAIVFALYKPNPGKDAEMLQLVARHSPTLRKFELITDRAPVICRSANGTIIEVFEWVDGDAHKRVRQHPEIAAIWEKMGAIGGMPTLGSLPEANDTFPHFEPV
jgi:quinol monooxygenase YgiN